MVRLPTGTVTFLFTDIEASTRVVQDLGDSISKQVFADHRRLLLEAVKSGGGNVYQDQGESFVFVFPRAKDAVLVAVVAQRALWDHTWPDGKHLRVRMGLHTGEPVGESGEYVGLDVHRAARICGAGHGGQIVLSQTTYELVADDFPDGVGVRDLGEHRLKDLARSQHLFQVVVAGLQDDFPPLKSLDALPNNLPVQLTSFVGREREIAEVERLLTTTRLLTLVGAGGCGKTRLALQEAAEVLEAFKQGVWFTDLAPLSDPALVPQTVASALSVQEQPGRSMLATLTDYLQPKQLLLILDNCEHLLSACAQFSDGLLRACPRLRILATSREELGIAGELTYRVRSLSVPDLRHLSSPESVLQHEAVRLFVERATFAMPTFRLTIQKAMAVTQVCARLDGIPLAIELAAARVKAMSVEQIASRLDDRFHLLTGGSRTALPRHQTLRGTMDWSYDLLPEEEQVLLRRLTAFAGGFTLEAAEAICAGGGVDADDVLDLLTHLVEKSLVVTQEQEGDVRYRLLETVRQYGREKLQQTGDEPAVRRRHRDWYLGLAERAEVGMQGADQGLWLDRVEAEHDNFRAALEWSKTEADSAEERLRLAGALWFFWFMRGYLSEGREWLVGALSRSSGASASAQAKVLNGAGLLAWRQGDDGRAAVLGEQGLVLCREVGHKWGIAHVLNTLGDLARHQGDYERAATLLEESLALFKELRNKGGIAGSQYCLGLVALHQGDYGRAKAFCEECLALCREQKDKGGIAWSLHHLGSAARHQRDYKQAAALLKESLAVFQELGQKPAIATSLDRLAGLGAVQGHRIRAARLFGAADAVRQAIKFRLPSTARADYEREVTGVRAGLGEEAFGTAWAEGQAMTLEQAIEHALRGESEVPEDTADG